MAPMRRAGKTEGDRAVRPKKTAAFQRRSGADRAIKSAARWRHKKTTTNETVRVHPASPLIVAAFAAATRKPSPRALIWRKAVTPP